MRRSSAVIGVVGLLGFMVMIVWLSDVEPREWKPTCAMEGVNNRTLCVDQYNCMWCLEDQSCRNVDYCESRPYELQDATRCRDYAISDVTNHEWYWRCRRADERAQDRIVYPLLFMCASLVTMCFACYVSVYDGRKQQQQDIVHPMRVEPVGMGE